MSLDRINLLPPEILSRRKSQKKNALFGVIGLAVGIALYGVYMSLAGQVAAEEAKLKAMQAHLGQLKSTVETFKVFEEEQASLQKQEELVTSVKATEVRWSEILDDISLIIPDDVQIDTFDGNGMNAPPTVQVMGRAADFEGVASFIVRLQNSKRFQEVILNKTSLAAEEGAEVEPGATVPVNYDLTIQLKAPEAQTAAPTGG